MLKIPSFFKRSAKEEIIEQKLVAPPSLNQILTTDNEEYFALISYEEQQLNAIVFIEGLKEFLTSLCHKIILMESLINKLVCDIAYDRFEHPDADRVSQELNRNLNLNEEFKLRVQFDAIANSNCENALEEMAHELIKYWAAKALILKNLCKPES